MALVTCDHSDTIVVYDARYQKDCPLCEATKGKEDSETKNDDLQSKVDELEGEIIDLKKEIEDLKSAE
jgi:peptidoglycan hydrolase CwlO-like protein